MKVTYNQKESVTLDTAFKVAPKVVTKRKKQLFNVTVFTFLRVPDERGADNCLLSSFMGWLVRWVRLIERYMWWQCQRVGKLNLSFEFQQLHSWIMSPLTLVMRSVAVHVLGNEIFLSCSYFCAWCFWYDYGAWLLICIKICPVLWSFHGLE